MEKLFVQVAETTIEIPAHCVGNKTCTSFSGYDVPNDGYGFFQMCFLGAVYAYILFFSSNMISDGY